MPKALDERFETNALRAAMKLSRRKAASVRSGLAASKAAGTQAFACAGTSKKPMIPNTYADRTTYRVVRTGLV
jgi:hypothetical protein